MILSLKGLTLSASDTGLRRVCIYAGTDVLDLSLPAAVPVATLIPSIIDIVNFRTGDPPDGPDDVMATRYQLSRPGTPPLLSSTTLEQNDIRHGTVLVLSKTTDEFSNRSYHDVAEAVLATLDATPGPQPNRNTGRLTGAVAAGLLTSTGALVLIQNSFDTNAIQYAGSTAGVTAMAGFISLLFATIAHRVNRDPITGLTMSLIATGFAAIAGLLAVPDSPGAANVLLAAMTATVVSVLALLVTGCGGITLTAVACFAVGTAGIALACVITSAPLHVIGSLSVLISLALLEFSPQMAIVLAGLSPILTTALDSDNSGTLPPTDRLATKAVHTDNWLTSLLAAFSSSAAIGAIITVLATRSTAPGFDKIAFSSVTGALLLLRSRSTDRRRTLVFFSAGIATIAISFAVAVTRAPQHGPWIAAATAVLAATSIYLGSVAPVMLLSPVGRRSVESLECLALVTLAPMACWICGFFGTVRRLTLI